MFKITQLEPISVIVSFETLWIFKVSHMFYKIMLNQPMTQVFQLLQILPLGLVYRHLWLVAYTQTVCSSKKGDIKGVTCSLLRLLKKSSATYLKDV